MAVVFLSLFVFAQLGAADALYFHFWKFRLFEVPETRPEHRVHTLMSVGFLGVVWGLWFLSFQGLAWWAMAMWQVATLALSFVDVTMEPRTRAGFGGLRPAEYLLHMLMNTLHGIALAAWVAVTYSAAALPTAVTRAHFGYPWPVQVVAAISLAAAVAMPVAHVYLALQARRGDLEAESSTSASSWG